MALCFVKGAPVMDIEQERKNRFRFLHRLWDVSGGDEHNWHSMWAIGEDLGLDKTATLRILQYLGGENLAVMRTLNGMTGITHYGIQEVEQALSRPSQPSHYFPPVNFISIGTMSHSTIQQASSGAMQQVQFDDGKIQQLQAVVAEIRQQLDNLQLANDERQQVQAELSTIEAQLAAPKPKRSIIAECLASLRTILEQATAALVAAPFLQKINKYLGT